MASRVGLAALAVVVVGVACASGAAARQPPSGTAVFVVRHDVRLCPSPRCGGYWVALANGARTRCADGLRYPRCYVARAVDGKGRSLADIPEEALVRGALDGGPDDLGRLVARAAYAPAGKVTVSGGFYRIVDNGIRCVRAPCYSYTATPVNGRTRVRASGLDLAASRASGAEVERALRATSTKNGFYARGRFARTADGGTVFRALRLYLRAPLPRA